MTCLEVSVVVFLAQGAHRVSTGVALLRTAVVSCIFASLDTLVKCILIFRARWALFIPLDPTEGARRAEHKWGYWTGHAATFALLYGAIWALPRTPWRDALPARPQFYAYCAAMAALNALTLLGTALLEGGVAAGYCVYGGATFAYYAGFPPLLYYTFLAGFYSDDDLALESEYYSEMHDSGFLDGLEDLDGDDF